MVEKALVVQGGKLIDGTGRPPVENSVIVIEAGRFQAVGRSGDVSIPADAQVIDVKGKTVLPGFIDGHGHLEDFHGELYLHLGNYDLRHDRNLPGRPMDPRSETGHRLGKNSRAADLDVWPRSRRRSAPGTTHPAREQSAATSSSRHRKRRARRCSGKRSSAATSSSQRVSFRGAAQGRRRRSSSAGPAGAAHSLGRHRAPSTPASTRSSTSGRSATAPSPMHRPGASWPEDRLAGRIDQEIAGSYYQTENYDRGDRRDGRASRRVDPDHRQMAPSAVAQRRALPKKSERNPERP